MHLLEIRHLLLVAAVADEGNLTRAGERLNLTQSALSHQLIDIEERLRTPLFHRLNRRMVLTEAGQRVLTSARRVLDDLAKTEDELRLYAADRRGVIRLTTECYTCYHWLPSMMKRFEKSYPGIEIRIDVDATDRPLEALLDGGIDLALISSERTERGIGLRPLFEDELLVIMSPDHRLARNEFVKTRDIAEETMLTYSTLKENFVYQRLLRPSGIEPKKHMQVRLSEAMVEMVKAGVGIAMMAQWAIAPYLDCGALVGLPLTRRGFKRRWKAAYLASRPLPAFLNDFIDMLIEYSPEAMRNSAPIPAVGPQRRRVEARSR